MSVVDDLVTGARTTGLARNIVIGRALLAVVRRYPLPAVCVAGIALLLLNSRVPAPLPVSASPRQGRGGGDHAEVADARGRLATHPAQIPAAGWRDILMRVKSEIGSDHLSLVCSGLAMYALLAVFPGLAAMIAIYGIFASPADVVHHMQSFSSILPPGTWELFSEQLKTLATQKQGSLTVAAVIGFGVALWGARAGMAALIIATNIAYSEAEKRGFIKQTLMSLAFTLSAIIGFLLVLAIGVVLPLALQALGTSETVQLLIGALRWLVLWAVAVAGLTVLYRYAPSRRLAQWRWVTWGSAIAATLWILVSVGFAFYVSSFASYGKTYGALGGVIALLMWFYLSSFTIVIGAEINAEMERQTKRDTTEGPEAPMGHRGAFAADTVGASAGEEDSRERPEQRKGMPSFSEHARA